MGYDEQKQGSISHRDQRLKGLLIFVKAMQAREFNRNRVFGRKHDREQITRECEAPMENTTTFPQTFQNKLKANFGLGVSEYRGTEEPGA